MTDAAIKKAIDLFKTRNPGFTSFADEAHELYASETAYKRKAVADIRDILGGFVSGDAAAKTDEEAWRAIYAAIQLTNFMNWRDVSYLRENLFAEDGRWLDFFNRLIKLLQSTANDYRPELSSMLAWLDSLDCSANISKILPTYFLFLWDPEHHICIKPKVFDTFLRAIDEPPTGRGVRLTLDTYERVLGIANTVRDALEPFSPKDLVDVHSFVWEVGRTKAPPKEATKKQAAPTPAPSAETADTAEPDRPDIALNLILCGPPGTGKTWQLLTEYQKIFEEVQDEQPLEDYVRDKCGDMVWHHVIAIALALAREPQSVSDLMNSLPVRVAVAARGRTQNVRATMWSYLQTFTPPECPHVGYAKRRPPGIFWKEEDKRWRLSDDADELIPEVLELAEKIRDYRPSSAVVRRYDFVTFHQSYAYEDFVEGIKPLVDTSDEDDKAGGIEYEVVPGIFKRLVNRALGDPTHSYALFVDEINRANIANVLGELITLLEPDKRLKFNPQSQEWEGGVRVRLPYTHSMDPAQPLFGIPDNLYVFGTMNTADRSVALLDHALRRRFTFQEVMPDPEVVKTKVGSIDDGAGGTLEPDLLLSAMNQRIEFLYDRDHTIGHSYLLSVHDLDSLENAFRYNIIPLLQEYFYGDWEKIQLVFNDLLDGDPRDTDGGPRAHGHAIVRHTPLRASKLLTGAGAMYQDRRSYEVHEELSAESFRKIYSGA